VSAVQKAARKPYRLVAPIVREHPIQATIAKVLTMEIAPAGKVSAHGVCWFAIDHANFAGEVPGVRIGRGIIAGVLDTFVLWRGLTHFIEVKADDGELSDHQRSVAAAVIAAQGRVGVARDWVEVLACVDTWGIPRKHRIKQEAA
jgi:hypothetical protein